VSLPELGVGIVYVPGLEPLLESGPSCVDVIEIEPQVFWHFKNGSRNPYLFPREVLSHLQALPQPKIVHSVGFGVGGTQHPPVAVAESLARAVRALNAPWVSEHLSFTHFDHGGTNVHTGFMLPALQTAEGAATAARTIRDFAARLPVPFAVETAVNYLEPRSGDMPDGEFAALVVEEADCGILLDLHNVWANEHNGRQSVAEFLAAIPLDRVWEIHLAGGFEFEGYWLDAHSGSIPAPVLEWAEQLIPALPNLKAVIYEIFPTFVPLFGLDNIEKQLERMASIWSRRTSQTRSKPVNRDVAPSGLGDVTPRQGEAAAGDWERDLGEVVVDGRGNGPLAQELIRDKGVGLIRKMIWKFRASAIVKSLGMLTQLIRLHCGEEFLEELLSGHFDETAPQAFDSEEAKRFIQYLRRQDLKVPYLSEIIQYEECAMLAVMEGKPQYMRFGCDPRLLLKHLAEGHVPEHLEAGNYELELTP